MPIDDGSNPKSGRTGYYVGRISNFFKLWCKRFGYGDLWYECMRLGSCGSQGKVQSNMMHVLCAQERMSVFTEGSHRKGIFLWSVFFLGLPMFEFLGGWVIEVKFRLLRDVLVQRIDCYLYSRRSSS